MKRRRYADDCRLKSVRIRGLLGWIAIAALAIPSGCAIFSGATVPDEGMALTVFEEAGGEIGVDGYRITTPRGWRYSRVEPESPESIAITGAPLQGTMEHHIRTVRMTGSPDQPEEPLSDYFAYRFELLGVRYRTASIERDGYIWVSAVAADDSTQMIAVAGESGSDMIIGTLLGETGSFALDERNVTILTQSISLSKDGDHAASAGDWRFDGALPEFAAPDRRWRWLTDVEDGYAVVGRIDGVPCIVSVSAVTQIGFPEVPGDSDGGSGSRHGEHLVFTGEAVYTVTSTTADDDEMVLMLVGSDHTYRLELTPLQGGTDGTGEIDLDGIVQIDDLAILIEHYFILDEGEVE